MNTVVEFDYNQTKPAQEKPEQTKPAHEKPEQPEWKIIPDSQLGTNPGAKVYSPDGKLHYAKFYDNPEQARHEHLANLLLEKLGVGVLDTQLIDLEFKEKKRLAIVSKWIDATPLKKLKDKPFTKTDKDQLTRQFLGAVLTGNRDIVGFDYDNLAKKGKSWYCIDQGGTFQFRAQGGNKSYEANAPEFESILKPGRKAGSVFNPILDDTLKKSPDTYSRWLKTLNRKTISEAVKSAGIDNEDLIDTIALRIDTIGKKINAYSKPKVTEKQHKRKHINEKLTREERVELIKEDGLKCGVEISENTAVDIIKNIYAYTGTDYSRMRDAQKGRINDFDALKAATLIEEYIDVAAYYPLDAKLYRGMRKKREEFNKVKTGNEYPLEALASSSTNYSSANKFIYNNETDVMLVIEGGTKYGTSIKHLTQPKFRSENEVLLSGRLTVDIIKKYEDKNGLLHVHVRVNDKKVKPITRNEILKGIIMSKNKNKLDKRHPRYRMTLEEKIRMVNEHEAEFPMIFMNPDGRQYEGCNGKIIELTPDHPSYSQELRASFKEKQLKKQLGLIEDYNKAGKV